MKLRHIAGTLAILIAAGAWSSQSGADAGVEKPEAGLPLIVVLSPEGTPAAAARVEVVTMGGHRVQRITLVGRYVGKDGLRYFIEPGLEADNKTALVNEARQLEPVIKTLISGANPSPSRAIVVGYGEVAGSLALFLGIENPLFIRQVWATGGIVAAAWFDNTAPKLVIPQPRLRKMSYRNNVNEEAIAAIIRARGYDYELTPAMDAPTQRAEEEWIVPVVTASLGVA